MMMRSAPMAMPGDRTLRRIFLPPGTLYGAAAPALVTTILGSCIAICLWDRRHHVGGMNHYVLPGGRGSDSLRYGDVAMARLVERMTGLGCRVEDLRAKIFGGATVLSFGAAEGTVGHRNLQMALNGLRHYGVPVVARRTGGMTGLFIRFHTASGEVMVRALRTSAPTDAPLD